LSISNIGAAATTTKIFRPPYGKIKSSQAKYVKAKGYKIIMWDVLVPTKTLQRKVFR
jgi:peptidoglycan/xylan/chitin deacetylase (PgdA/CDA1 family)